VKVKKLLLNIVDFVLNSGFFSGSFFAVLVFFTIANDYYYFPNNEDDLIHGEYRVGYIGPQRRSGGIQLNAYDRDGQGLIFSLENAGLGTQAYSKLESISGKNEYITIGWYSGCLFGRVNFNWPCAVEVTIKKNEEVYLSFDKSKKKFENKTAFSKFIGTYNTLVFAILIFIVGLAYYLIKRK